MNKYRNLIKFNKEVYKIENRIRKIEFKMREVLNGK